jgi:hypothetical protein
LTRDIDALLNSLVNIDRNSLVAILSSEAGAARQLITAARSRTASQRAKRRDAEQHAARLDRMLLFFQHRDVVPGMSPRDIKLCRIVEQKLRASGQPSDPPVSGLNSQQDCLRSQRPL